CSPRSKSSTAGRRLLGWPYFLKKKSDAASVFATFLADIRADGCPSVVECVRSDNGTE
ncbi:unnamed protein product, partial [Laminaria digitata]